MATAGQEQVNPEALPLEGFIDEVMDLLAADPTPQEVVGEQGPAARALTVDPYCCGDVTG